MDRVWSLTWTTYGSWLPGDPRGSTTSRRVLGGGQVRLNVPTLSAATPLPGLQRWARNRMTGQPVRLARPQAVALLDQFRETATIRGWTLLACAIMANYVHLVVGVEGDPDPASLLRDFKRYGSRALSRKFGSMTSQSWWTSSGSRRRLMTDGNVVAAIDYVRHQQFPLLIWVAATEERAG